MALVAYPVYDRWFGLGIFDRPARVPLLLTVLAATSVMFAPFWRLEVFVASQAWSTRVRLAVMAGWVGLVAATAWAFVRYGP